MRSILLASSLLLTPTLAFSEPTCTIPVAQAASAEAASTTTSTTASPITPISQDRIGRVPALRRIASNGAQLFDLGTEHGLQAVFAKNGDTFQVFYIAPDGQAAVGGVMWGSNGHNITRGQVAPIDGTIPTVTIGTPAIPGPIQPASATAALPNAPAASALAAVEKTTFGTTGPASAPRLYMFIDPLCSFSVRAMDQLQSYVAAGKIQLAVIPLSVLDYEDQGRSTPAAKSLLSLPADKMVEAWRHQMTNPLPAAAPEATDHLEQNMAAAQALALRGTPTFVWRKADGSYPPGEGRLPGLMMAGDLKGVRTSAVKDRGGLLDGDHHWG